MAYATGTMDAPMWSTQRHFWRSAGATAHVVLRIGAALLFMQHGAQKLLGWFGGMGGEGATAELVSLMGLAGALELFGGLLLLIGLLTRPLALVLFVEMIAAYVMAHLPQGAVPVQNQGELALLYGLTFLYFAGNGAGKLSVDHWIASQRRRSGRAPVDMMAPNAEPMPRRRGHAA